jgi:leucyl-tRNA synthetase
MMAPITPHIAEELWTEHLGKPYSIHQQPWPQVDEAAAAREDSIAIPVNRSTACVPDKVVVPADAGEDEIKSAAMATGASTLHINPSDRSFDSYAG